MKFLKREERRRERERRRQNKEIEKVQFSVPLKKPVVEPDNRLGPLGHFLKNLIVANTFVN